MTSTAVPLENLVQSIARQQFELDALRKELEARQAHLADLKSQKGELEGQLRQLDAVIQAVSQGETALPAAAKAVPAALTSKSSTPPRPKKMAPTPAKAKPPKKMVDLIVDIVGESKGPITARPLAAELQKRGFFMASPNLLRIVQVRVNDLMREGILRRAGDQPGVVLGKAKSELKASGTKVGGAKQAVAPKASGRVGSDGKVSLRPLLKELLAKSQRPMKAKELAELAVAGGYATESTDFRKVVGIMLARMQDVKNVPGVGYRLKKR
jgi:hypothetical protein